MFFKKDKNEKLAFEESLGEGWSRDLEVMEVPLGNRPLLYLGAIILLAGLVLVVRIFYLNFFRGQFYAARAEANLTQYQRIPAPRGLIYDRNGKILADNRGIFTALIDTKEFLRHPELQDETLSALEPILFIPSSEIWNLIQAESAEDFSSAIVLSENLDQSQLVQLKALNSPFVIIQNGFERQYADGPVFASILGYTGRVSSENLKDNPELNGEDTIGKAGVEAFYNQSLSGEPGIFMRIKDSRGKILSEEKKNDPAIGESLRLTIDGEFQRYFYSRMQTGLRALGRRIGVGIAVNPENGEILSLVNLPSFDNNLLGSPGHNEEKLNILNSEEKPLFNRAVSGFYNPGSTIKPLVGVAALKEGVIDPKREIFSPGYLDVPNPYDPENPTRFFDWRYQGNVNLASAIAQSSNVYFYLVGGGSTSKISPPEILVGGGEIKGLGISRLRDWWQKFGLGKLTGIDLPAEAEGFLPSVEWKKDRTKKPWLLGDTYNVAIGQGDLLLTPIQLLDYISGIANGGKIYEPVLNIERQHPKILADLSYLRPEMIEVEKGMKQAVTAPLGTAYRLHDLAFSVAAKTGSAQVQNNTQENALFVGYLPAEVLTKAGAPNKNGPPLAILILIENSIEGSLNAVPIAKDVLDWYYWNRISGKNN